ncbi:MAG: hypothetical protein WC975_16100 [Phycisphaerae bacterium]
MMKKDDFKMAVSVVEMADMVGLCRGYFYELVESGVFLPPVYDLRTHRPFYPPEIQEKNLEYRNRGKGANGQPVVFYRPRVSRDERKQKACPNDHKTGRGVQSNYLTRIENLNDLGLSDISEDRLRAVVAKCFPQGTQGIDECVIIKTVYWELKDRAKGVSL